MFAFFKLGFKLVDRIRQRHREQERRQAIRREIAGVQRGADALIKSTHITWHWKTNDFGKVRGDLHDAMAAALDNAANTAVKSAKRRVPVLTGNLRDSIRRSPIDRSGSRLRVVISTDVEYAPFVEFGGAHSAAHPYIRPGATSGIRRFKTDVRKEAKRRLPHS